MHPIAKFGNQGGAMDLLWGCCGAAGAAVGLSFKMFPVGLARRTQISVDDS